MFLLVNTQVLTLCKRSTPSPTPLRDQPWVRPDINFIYPDSKQFPFSRDTSHDTPPLLDQPLLPSDSLIVVI